jgi:CheY-like chemotaxis protein
MPGMDGGKVFETLRRDAELSSTRVCIVSGKPELRRLIYERPVPPPEGYLDKPVSEESFLLNVRKILELSAAEKPEETPVN